MAGGSMVWLTDKELKELIWWYGFVQDQDGDTIDGDRLMEKLEVAREEVACRVPGKGRTLARDREVSRVA